MTLKHIIELSGRTEKLSQALSCPQAQSLFEAVPWNRSCDDACIPFVYCTCDSYKPNDANDSNALKAAHSTIDWINKKLEMKARKNNKPLCAVLNLTKVLNSHKSEASNTNSSTEFVTYLVMFETSPSKAIFEATVEFHQTFSETPTIAEVSRVNAYGDQSRCVESEDLKLYCYCNELS
jgi:hypothetical protein